MRSRNKWIIFCLQGMFCFGAAGTHRVTAQNDSSPIAVQDPSPAFAGEKKDWHGFDRYDFMMDEETLAITPFKRAQDEGFGVRDPAKGQRRCIVVVPKQDAPGHPWSWRGCYWDHQPQTEVELLRRGFHVAYISASATLRPDKTWDAWYAFLQKQGLSPKPAFIGMSRGGEFAYIWATTHPDKVSCIYADNPGMNKETLKKFDALAMADVPLLHVCGSIDPLFGDNTLFIENLYQHLGGRISLMIKEGFGHHPHSLHDPGPIADWIERYSKAVSVTPPAFVGANYIRSNYYGTQNVYKYFPSERAYITCRGPLFTGCYNRYTFGIDGVMGTVVVTVPEKEAPGKPWVFRAGFAGRDAAVDLALLERGYTIVTGPVSYNSDSLLLKDWNATYKLLTDHGFSAKPVMEGAGGAAGEVYGWAIQNSGKVSCIYSENPLLRSTISPAQPLDHLDLLAKAGVPLLDVCGSLDPGLKDNARVAEKRYKALGGRIRVIVKEGEGHYSPAPQDPEAAVEFIVKNTGRETKLAGTNPRPRAYIFDRTISRKVLENYLSRAITMQNLLTGQGNFDDNLRMLKSIGAKYIGRSVC
jgi:pimeloyl-ACP methyl ester carboxylesterase